MYPGLYVPGPVFCIVQKDISSPQPYKMQGAISFKRTAMQAITAIIETPGGSRLKFKPDKKLKCFRLHKILPAGMVFPFDFGFIPGTRGGDGDPLDIMVISEFTTFTGCAIDCRIIGAILAEQTEKDGKCIRNDRLLAIPLLSGEFKKIKETSHLPAAFIKELRHFFISYNREAGRQFKVLDVVGSQAAMKLIKTKGAAKKR